MSHTLHELHDRLFKGVPITVRQAQIVLSSPSGHDHALLTEVNSVPLAAFARELLIVRSCPLTPPASQPLSTNPHDHD